MSFSPELAEIRFGCGLSPDIALVSSEQALLDGLTGPDDMARTFPIETLTQFRARMIEGYALRKRLRKARGTPDEKTLRKERNLQQRAAREAMVAWQGQTFLRWTNTTRGFRERLVFFWRDHFTAQGKAGLTRRATSPYIEEAIRPNIAGSFADLLIAATTSPLMLTYLDQHISIGPDSLASKKRARKKRGLNENLAREMLELHTLGVDGPYTQQDVRQLAELFTGMSFTPRDGFVFRAEFAEPGAETVLGHSYGGDPARFEAIETALRDLAMHPATARHIAWKLAVHFVSDTPDPGLVDHVAARYGETGGDLMAVYQALLEHPAAWDPVLRNIKPPADFMASACRALAVPTDIVQGLNEKRARQLMITPMQLMGQSWQKPPGPDGWPEEDSAWLTPQGVAARMRWAMAAPLALRRGAKLPEPVAFVDHALGSHASEPVRFAARAAESRPEAIGLILSSPDFQRR